MSAAYIASGATISACGRYRYRLWREWRGTHDTKNWRWMTDARGQVCKDGAGLNLGEPWSCVFIMLNPSTADGKHDDPTIRRCVAFAKAWKFERMEVVNLFAYRATDPRELLRLGHDDDPVGAENQRHIEDATVRSKRIVCAWGAHGGHLDQDETVLGWLVQHQGSDCVALGLTKDGKPRHPLYMRTDAQPVPFGGPT